MKKLLIILSFLPLALQAQTYVTAGTGSWLMSQDKYHWATGFGANGVRYWYQKYQVDSLFASLVNGVSSFNTRTGAVTLNSTDVTTALGFTPENVANKATSFSTLNNTLYPTTQAVANSYVPQTTTVAGFALSGNITLYPHTPGYGLSGSNYAGSSAQTWVLDTATISNKYLNRGKIVWPSGSPYTSPTEGAVSAGAIIYSPALANELALSIYWNNSTSAAPPQFSAPAHGGANTLLGQSVSGILQYEMKTLSGYGTIFQYAVGKINIRADSTIVPELALVNTFANTNNFHGNVIDSASTIKVTGIGVAPDGLGPINVTMPSTDTTYAYYGMTRSGNFAAGEGMDGTNNWIWGTGPHRNNGSTIDTVKMKLNIEKGNLTTLGFVSADTVFTQSVVHIPLGGELQMPEGTNGHVGQTALVSGTKAITIAGVTTTSRAFISFVSINGGTVTTTWQYAGVCTANTVTITALTNTGSTDTSDTSILNYTVIN